MIAPTVIQRAITAMSSLKFFNSTDALNDLLTEELIDSFSKDEEVLRATKLLVQDPEMREWPGLGAIMEYLRRKAYPHGMVKPNATSGWVPNPKNGPEYNRRYKQCGQEYEYWQEGRFHEGGTPARESRPVEQDLMTGAEFMATDPQFRALLKKTAMPSIERRQLAPRWTPDRSDESEAA